MSNFFANFIVRRNKPQEILKRLGAKLPVVMRDEVLQMGIIQTAQEDYLNGPYPQVLRRGYAAHGGSGHLAQSLMPRVRVEGNEIIGEVYTPSSAYYAAIWEAVGRWSYRKGGYFANGTPKWRPFVHPAYEDLKAEISDTLQESLGEGL